MKSNRLRKALASACVFAISLCAVAAPVRAQTPTQPRPNVIVILVDDMGWADLGCYGSEISTPNIDALAATGVRFTQFYNCARCSPSRSAILTGLYPHQAGLGHLDNIVHEGTKGTQGKLRDDCVTMAEVLAPAGYFTIMCGKWHLGQQHGTPPWARGFNRSLNSAVGEVYFPNQNNRPDAPLFLNGEPHPITDPIFGPDWYGPDLFTQWGLKFIDEARAENKPFFLYLAHCSPHFPFKAPQEDIARYKGHYMAGWDVLRDARQKRQIEMGLIDPRWPLSPRPPEVPAWNSRSEDKKQRFDTIMSVYAAVLDRMDRSVGTLVDGLRERGMLDNTLIFFLSDNGGNAESGPAGKLSGDPAGGPTSTVYLGQDWATLANTPFRRYKHFTHEGGISTPLVVHWPARIPAARNGQLVRDPGHIIDLMPTVVEAAGAKYPADFQGHTIQPMQGVSLLPALAGQPLVRPSPIYWEHEGNHAIRKGKWKLVAKYTEPWELYDIEADRTEQHNLIDEQPGLARELEDDWTKWAARSDVDPWTGPPRKGSGDEIKSPADKNSTDSKDAAKTKSDDNDDGDEPAGAK